MSSVKLHFSTELLFVMLDTIENKSKKYKEKEMQQGKVNKESDLKRNSYRKMQPCFSALL